MINTTAIIVNFLREPYLKKCVDSLRLEYPDIKIIVGENGHYSKSLKDWLKSRRVEYYEVGWDAGVCKARNFLVDNVKTKYTLVGDDDFYYTKKANVDKMINFLEIMPNVDLIGGRIYENGRVRDYQGFMEKNGRSLIYSKLDPKHYADTNFENQFYYELCDITFNFFVAKTSVLKECKWDENIKVAYEHSDFFLKLKEENKMVAFTPNAIVGHKPEIDEKISEEYKNFRNRKSDKAYFFKKHGISFAIDMNGKRDELYLSNLNDVDFLIKTFRRHESLEKLLFSIVKFYPEAKITIADDGGDFKKEYYLDLWQRLSDAGIKNKPCVFNLPFDTGLSESRNILVKNSFGKYKLILDDDFVFNENTDIPKMVSILEQNPKAGVIGGSLLQDGTVRHYEGNLAISDGVLNCIPLESKEYPAICDIVFNFCLIRNEVFAGGHWWDPQFKISGEHTDFFLRLKETDWKVLYDPAIQILHEQSLSPEYKEMRSRQEFWVNIFKKHNIYKIINFNGIVWEQSGNAIIRSRV